MRIILSLLLVLLSSLAISRGGKADAELLAWTRAYAGGFGLDADLVIAVVHVESRYCPTAVSPKGAVGLGQFMPGTAAELGIDPHHPLQNLWATAKYLREKYLEWEDWTLALAAYNAGSGAVQRFGGVPPYPETEHYVKEVLRVYRDLRERSER